MNSPYIDQSKQYRPYFNGQEILDLLDILSDKITSDTRAFRLYSKLEFFRFKIQNNFITPARINSPSISEKLGLDDPKPVLTNDEKREHAWNKWKLSPLACTANEIELAHTHQMMLDRGMIGKKVNPLTEVPIKDLGIDNRKSSELSDKEIQDNIDMLERAGINKGEAYEEFLSVRYERISSGIWNLPSVSIDALSKDSDEWLFQEYERLNNLNKPEELDFILQKINHRKFNNTWTLGDKP